MKITPKYIYLFLIIGTILQAQELHPLIPQIDNVKTVKPAKTSLYLRYLINYLEKEKNTPQSARQTLYNKLNETIYQIDAQNRIHIRIKAKFGYDKILQYLHKVNILVTGTLENYNIIDCLANANQIKLIENLVEVTNI